jgi:trehalose-6-phosphate synthase
MPKLIVASHYLPIEAQIISSVDSQLDEKDSFKLNNFSSSNFDEEEESGLVIDPIINTFEKLRISLPDSDASIHLHPRKAYSALYSAIHHLEETESCLWVGIPSLGISEEYQNALSRILIEKFRYHPIFIDQEHHQNHYDIYCKTILWPVLHYMVWNRSSEKQAQKEAFLKYCQVNELFARKIVEVYEPGDDSKTFSSFGKNTDLIDIHLSYSMDSRLSFIYGPKTSKTNVTYCLSWFLSACTFS